MRTPQLFKAAPPLRDERLPHLPGVCGALRELWEVGGGQLGSGAGSGTIAALSGGAGHTSGELHASPSATAPLPCLLRPLQLAAEGVVSPPVPHGVADPAAPASPALPSSPPYSEPKESHQCARPSGACLLPSSCSPVAAAGPGAAGLGAAAPR